MSATNKISPRIFLGCLASYNAGEIFGQWLDLEDYDTEEELWEAVEAVLAASPAPNAEEYMVQDFEGFYDFSVGEYEPMSELFKLAKGIEEHGEAYAMYCINMGEIAEVSAFEEAYLGVYENERNYAQEYFDEIGGQVVPEAYINFFDFEALGRDLMLSDCFSAKGREGLHVFRNL